MCRVVPRSASNDRRDVDAGHRKRIRVTRLPSVLSDVQFLQFNILFADVAELADAYGSGPYESNFMQVQVREPFLKE